MDTYAALKDQASRIDELEEMVSGPGTPGRERLIRRFEMLSERLTFLEKTLDEINMKVDRIVSDRDQDGQVKPTVDESAVAYVESVIDSLGPDGEDEAPIGTRKSLGPIPGTMMTGG